MKYEYDVIVIGGGAVTPSLVKWIQRLFGL
jgi:hypothetical protein